MGVDIEVSHDGYGRAIPVNAKFDYIDVWSSRWSWKGKEPPVKGM